MSNSLNGFRDNANNNGPDFGYDAFGNMTSDANKRIESIAYNHLNLPTAITFQNSGGHIRYTYDALGVKVRKEVDDLANNTTTTTDYLDGFQYKNEALVFFPTAEGYVEFATPEKWFYVYNYTDHLGNVRMSYTDEGSAVPKILEETHYYPFGLKHENYASEVFERIKEPNGELFVIQPTERREWQYKFQGQERQDELNLNWDSFKWRNYDYAIGRFMSVDPLAPDFPQWSPYVFSGNLVTISKELEGMEPEFLVQGDGKLTSGAVTLMHSAYGYSTSSLQNSTWIVSSDPRVSGWDKLTGHPEASVKGTQVMYSKDVVNEKPNYWFGLISHEQSHRQDVENQGDLSFYSQYLGEGIFKDYEDISTEKRAFKMGSDDNNVDMADKLLSYKDGAVMDIFQRGNLTNNEKASMLEAVGNQFKRDVVLQGNIDGAKSGLRSMKDMKWDNKTKASMTKLLKSLINHWTIQQNEITKKYGE